jgi:hypothetical protein
VTTASFTLLHSRIVKCLLGYHSLGKTCVIFFRVCPSQAMVGRDHGGSTSCAIWTFLLSPDYPPWRLSDWLRTWTSSYLTIGVHYCAVVGPGWSSTYTMFSLWRLVGSSPVSHWKEFSVAAGSVLVSPGCEAKHSMQYFPNFPTAGLCVIQGLENNVKLSGVGLCR